MTEPVKKPDDALPKSDLAGRKLGDYRLLRRLGRGAMASVYLAEQCTLQRRVAVKVLKPELAEDQTYLKRFQIEARAAASLVHANIVQIYEVGRVEQFHFIAQEYVQGQNLLEWTTRHGPPDLPHALSIIYQVAAALTKAAEQGIVHRDIKPENILLTRSGEVKVADFGLAHVTREGGATNLTQIGVTLGTPLYMSPEQVEGKPLDPRSDIYSLGVTCYHMLAGRPPFQGETALGVAVQHLKKKPEPLENLRPDLPPTLCRIVHQMLAKDPARRCQSARDLLKDLRRLQREHFDEKWPSDLPSWETVAIDQLLSDTRAEATQRLDHLMKAASARSSGRRRRQLYWIGVVWAFLIGGAAAWFTLGQPTALGNLPPVAKAETRKASALLQYLHASRVGTEDAWKSVIKFYGKKQYISNYAKQQLGRIYLREAEYRQALFIFDEFALSGDEDKELRAFGLAGQFACLVLLKEYGEAAQVLDELYPLRLYLRDPQMHRLLESALRKNRLDLRERTALQWEQFLSDSFPQGD